MKISSKVATLVAFAALAACGGGETADNGEANLEADVNAGLTDYNTTADLNALPADNVTVDANNVTVVENGGGNATDATNTTNGM